MGVAPEAIVAPPPTAPPAHNLLASAIPVKEPDGSRWEAGFQFRPENCAEAEAYNPCGFTDEQWEIIVDAGSGSWEIDFDGNITAPIVYNASAYDVQVALEALPNIDLGDVVVVGGPGNVGGTTPYYLTFTGQYAGVDVPDPAALSIDLAGGAGISQTEVQAAGEPVVKQVSVNPDDVLYCPPQHVLPYQCSSYGFPAADYEGRARRQIEVAKIKSIEAEFWTGSKVPHNPSLRRSTPNDDGHILNPGGAAAPTAVSPSIALMLLSQALANCATGGLGTIHATPATVERWVSTLNTKSDDGRLSTLGRGDIVVSGSGYPGTGPLGQPPPGPNEVWAYATGLVNIREGDTEVFPDTFAEAMDRATNTVTYYGEVTAAVTWDLCCTFAVLIDLCGL